MAYTIDKYNNTQLTVIEDGTIDQTTDLKLVGKNYAGYGEIQNENFVFLLENFAGSAAPSRALQGQIWFDTDNSKLKFYDGFQWRTSGGAEVNNSVPAGLKVGDFWWDSGNEQLYTYNGTDFVLIGPQSAGSGQTQITSRSVRDTGGTSRGIITAVVNDEVVFTISSQDFTIDTTDVDSNIPGFDRIHQGLTLKNTLNSNGGVTSGAIGQGFRLWGTSSNSEKLGGFPASDYITTQNADFGQLATFSDLGLEVGISGDLKLYIQYDNQGVIENNIGTQLVFKAKDINGVTKNPLRILANAVIPGYTIATENNPTPDRFLSTLGTVDYPWAEVHSDSFKGTADVATSLEYTAANNGIASGSETVSAGTVVIRTVAAEELQNGQIIDAGSIKAAYFVGTATQAQYADLAEVYSTNENHPVGTVMIIGTQEDYEAEPSQMGGIPVGVISENPAYLMNAEAEGQPLALKGRVPVRVVGTVKKGDAIYAGDDGCGTTVATFGFVGIALESNDTDSEKLVECVLKV